MGDWHPFGATNKPGTCLWCGRKLRRRTLPIRTGDVVPPGYHLTGRLSTDAWGHEQVTVAADKSGDYQDDHFCGLRCGFRYAQRIADLGDRLEEFVPGPPARSRAGARHEH